jgi:hypothetical protein
MKRKRVIDLSSEELGAMGAKAARRAVQQAREAGLTVTGTVDRFDGRQSASTIALLHPSGTVTLAKIDTVEDAQSQSSQSVSVLKAADD